MKIEELRTHFPHTAHQTYVNHAAVSPISRPVRQAIEAYLDSRHGATPEAPIEDFDGFQSIMVEAKERAAHILGTVPEQVEFVPNTSSALNILAQGLTWTEGDRIAIPDGTFPANVYPFLNLEKQGVSVDFIPTDEGAYTLDSIEQTLRPETRLLSLSWVHFLSGFRADLDAVGRLCDAHDVLFCVDAIQGLGALQLDVEAAGIDFLASGCHKWLMATQGIGLLYCDEDLQDRLHPPTGWLHGPVDWEHLDRYELAFHDDARRFRTGTLNAVGVVALNAALKLYLDAGPAWCEDRILDLSTTLADELSARGFSRYGSDDPTHASGIVTIAPDDPDSGRDLHEYLLEAGVTAALRNRKLRFAPTYYNDEDDIRTILDAIDWF